MQYIANKKVISILLINSLSLLSGHVSAKELALEEVVVTARKKVESMQDTPVAVTAFNSDELRQIRAFDMTDLGAFTPNVQILASPASSSNIGVSIRGISSGDPALDPKIGFYLDGVYLARNTGAVFDVVDLDRVEVLRGPQGTLWGKNTTGGAISLITRKPEDKFGFEQLLSVGNNSYWRAKTRLDLPLSESLYASVTALATKSDGWAKNHSPSAPSKLGNDDTSAWSASLRWVPTDNLTVDYTYDFQRRDAIPKPLQLLVVDASTAALPTLASGISNPYAEALTVASPNNRREDFNLDYVDRETVEVGGYNLTLAADFSNWTFKSITARRNFHANNRGTDSDGGSYVSALYHELSDKSQNQLSQEFQILGSALDTKLDYVVGLFYFREKAGEDTSQMISPALDVTADGSIDGVMPLDALGVALPFYYSIENTSKAAYGQATYTPEILQSRLNFTVGARYTEDDKKASLRNSTILNTESGKYDWSKATYTAGMQYFPYDNINLFAKYTTGYNAGQFNLRASTVSAFEVPANEENIHAYEIGIKTDLLSSRLRLNIAAFYNEYDDLQVSQFRADHTGASSVLTNAGEATAKGVEVETTALVTEQFQISMRYGYVDMEYARYLDGQGNDISHIARAPYTPAHTASGTLQYAFEPWSFGRLSARIDIAYSDSYTFNPIRDIYANAGSHTLIDARLDLAGVRIGQGESRLSLWIKNIEDKEYRVWGIDFGVDGGALPFAGATYGDPRSFGVDLVYEF